MAATGYTLKAVILQSADTIIRNIGIYQLEGDNRSKLPKPSNLKDTLTGDFAVLFITNDGVTEKVRRSRRGK